MSPAISVLMAVRNGGGYLDESIRSIVAQSFTDWEMVIVDDGSTDASADLARGWASRDKRVRVHVNPSSKGQTASLNHGLSLCRGEWIARQDADDISHPDRLRLQMEHASVHREQVLLGTQGILIDSRGKRIGLLDVPEDADSIGWCSPFLNPFLHTSVMFQRRVVIEAGGYDENFRIAQDYELWTRLAAGYPVANLGERLVRYRKSDDSLSVSGRDLTLSEADRVSDREVARWLGRPWSQQEKTLVSGFRKGLRPEMQKAFWRMVGSLEQETSAPLASRLRAAWHLRLAGAGGLAGLGQVVHAFRAAPVFTAAWLPDRFLSS